MKETELKEISEKFDDMDMDNVLHFVLTVYSGKDEDDYYIVCTQNGQKIALNCGSGEGFGVMATNPRDTIYELFKNELGFTEYDFKNLEFKGDCGDTLLILAKADDFFKV